MGIFDWLGPLNAGGKSARGWDALPSPQLERKASYTIDDFRAVLTVNTLVHGPGATDLIGGWRGNDSNSAVYACLDTICSAYVEAPLAVYRQVSPKDREPLFDSPLQDLLDDPNPELDPLEILWWWNWAKHVDGNAYLRKLRAGDELTGNVVQLWPISPMRIEPRTERGSGELISYYRYHDRPGHFEDIPRENIIHGRTGVDDRDHRLGCSPLKRLVREVATDDAATRYSDHLLKNYAVPGLALEFDKDSASIDRATADELKARINAAYGGDNVGSTAVLSPGARLSQLGWSPEQLDLQALHKVPEERISAVMGVPAIVAGLGAGLVRSTYANFEEARADFTERKILGLYRADDMKLTKSLRPDFTSDRKVVVAHDISQMRALQDDENKRAERLKVYVEAGILDVDEARAEIGREPRTAPPAALPAPGASERSRRALRPPLVVVRMSLDDLPGQFGRLKDSVEPDWLSDLEAFLAAQVRRITGRLRAGDDSAEGLVPDTEVGLLSDVLEPRQLALFDAVRGLVAAELGVAFDVDDPLTREYLRSAGANIGGITETTRSAVRAALVEGQAQGEGIPQLAARLRELPAFNRARAITVSRTELGHAANTAAIANYRASGVVVGVTVYDGDYDAECQAMNGRKFPLDRVPPTLQHPRCLRAFAPIVDAAELERSA